MDLLHLVAIAATDVIVAITTTVVVVAIAAAVKNAAGGNSGKINVVVTDAIAAVTKALSS